MDLAAPCRRCQIKGWSCTAEDKVVAPEKQIKGQTTASLPGISSFTISKSLTRDSNDIIPGLDSKYLEYIFDPQTAYFASWFDPMDGRPEIFDISSPPTRAAVLVLAASLQNRIDDQYKYFA